MLTCRRRPIGFLLRTVALVAAIVAGSLLLATPARANGCLFQPNYPPCAIMERNIYLSAKPTINMTAAYQQRSIYLGTGTYLWSYYVTSAQTGLADVQSRTIFLTAGTYAWTCQIVPYNGWYSNACSLSTPGHQIAFIGSTMTLSLSTTYIWHAELDRNSLS